MIGLFFGRVNSEGYVLQEFLGKLKGTVSITDNNEVDLVFNNGAKTSFFIKDTFLGKRVKGIPYKKGRLASKYGNLSLVKSKKYFNYYTKGLCKSYGVLADDSIIAYISESQGCGLECRYFIVSEDTLEDDLLHDIACLLLLKDMGVNIVKRNIVVKDITAPLIDYSLERARCLK